MDALLYTFVYFAIGAMLLFLFLAAKKLMYGSVYPVETEAMLLFAWPVAVVLAAFIAVLLGVPYLVSITVEHVLGDRDA